MKRYKVYGCIRVSSDKQTFWRTRKDSVIGAGVFANAPTEPQRDSGGGLKQTYHRLLTVDAGSIREIYSVGSSRTSIIAM